MAEAKEKRDYRQELTDEIIKRLEEGTAPWQKPWTPGVSGAYPHNPTTGKPYRGINSIHLTMVADTHGYNDPRWMTYKQAEEKGFQVRKGEHGTLIEYWKFHEEKKVFDEQGKPVMDEETGKQKTVRYALETPRPFRAVVFNAAQIDNVPEWKNEPKAFDWEPSERAEQIIRDSGARIYHDQGDRAFYSPSKDEIHLPDREQFKTTGAYYGTALHELGHWTGHKSRLDRELAQPFGSEGYAKEELRAELASYFMSNQIGIEHDPGQHAAYVKSWVKALKEDKNEIFRASRDAERITEFLVSPELAKNVELSRASVERESVGQTPEPQQGVPVDLKSNEMPAPGDTGYRAFMREVGKEQEATDYFQQVKADAAKLLGDGIETKLLFPEDGGPVTGRVIADSKFTVTVQTSEMEATVINKMELRQLPSVGQEVVIGQIDPKNPANGRSIQVVEPERQVQSGKTYLDVPFKEKGEAKALGAKWEGDVKKWVVPAGTALEPFKKWMTPPNQDRQQEQQAMQPPRATEDGKVMLHVPFNEKGRAKENGARWDSDAKSWYAPPGADLEKLQKWLQKPQQQQQQSNVDPVTAFTEFARNAGLVIDGQPVIGKLTRVAVEDGPKGNKDGAYILHLDGRPSGFVQNFKADIKENWTHQGQQLSAEEVKNLAAHSAEVKAQRTEELKQQHEYVAGWAEKKFNGLPLSPVDGQSNGYLDRKQVSGFGVRFDGDKIVVPLRDIEGKLWSMQSIEPQEGGNKHLTKNARKEGNMHVIGTLEPGKDILVAEGYATAASLHMATGKAVVMAVDSGNLESVVGQLKEKYPTSPMFIMGDDDRFNPDKNVGASKAAEAAEKHQVAWALPKFKAEGKLVDFNDLHVKEGLDTVRQQVEQTISNTLMDSKMLAKDQVKQKLDNGGTTDIVEKATGNNTRHSGPFVSVGSYHAVQQVAKNEVVVHEIAKMDRKPEVGQDATVQYRDGRAVIKDRQQDRQNEKSKGASRELAA